MINKIIIFGDYAGKDFTDFWSRDYLFMKTSALTRLGYMLRNENFEVKQVHHCTSFTRDELDYIITEFAAGDPVLILISTSFITATNRIDYVFHADDKYQDHTQIELGSFWGEKAFKFFQKINDIAKRRNTPVLMGGFDILEYKFHDSLDVQAWALDYLTDMVNCFVIGNNIDVITKFCRNEKIKYKVLRGKLKNKPALIAYSTNVVDYSDCASTLMPSDFISRGESLVTEISGGCVFACSFCTYKLLGKKKDEYTRTYQSLKTEIVSNYQNFGTTYYQLTDNMINDWFPKMEYLARIRDETGIDVRWGAYARLDTIKTKEHAQLFKDSGCAGVIFGIESFNKETGPYLGKMTDKERLVETLHMFRDAVGNETITSGSFISGAPHETKEHLQQTYEWLIGNEGKHLLDHFIFTPLFIEPNVNDTNSITRARNNPFRDYVLADGKDGQRGINWTSPWGTYQEFLDLTLYYSRANNRTNTEEEFRNGMRGVFSLPVLNNVLDMTISEIVTQIRNREPIHYNLKDHMSLRNNQLIQEYRQKTLTGYK